MPTFWRFSVSKRRFQLLETRKYFITGWDDIRKQQPGMKFSGPRKKSRHPPEQSEQCVRP